MSPVDRARVVATKIGMRDAPVADSADGTRTPCNGRLLQAQQTSAKISTRAGPKKSRVLLNFTGFPQTKMDPITPRNGLYHSSEYEANPVTSVQLVRSLPRQAPVPLSLAARK